MIDSFTNLYSLSKTLRFSLIPIGKTEEHFNAKILEDDLQRSEDYPVMKRLMDEYHKKYIEEILAKVEPTDLPVREYADLYYKRPKDSADMGDLATLEEKMRKEISDRLQRDPKFKQLFEKTMINDFLKEVANDEEDLAVINRFSKFTTYFVGFNQNRKNMYTKEAQTTAIANRSINENLPRFLDNSRIYRNRIISQLSAEIDILNDDISGFGQFTVGDMFSLDYFAYTLPQSGIDDYNRMLGGYSTEDGTKVKGLNEYINLFNQKVTKAGRMPQLKPLYKQILSDRETVSFIPERFESDDELLRSVYSYYNLETEDHISIKDCVASACRLVNDINDYDPDGVLISNSAISGISQKVFGEWGYIEGKWDDEYDAAHSKSKKNESYYDKRKKAYKAINAFSIKRLGELTGEQNKITEELIKEAQELSKTVEASYLAAESLIANEYTARKRLSQNNKAIERLKRLLDAIKDAERFIRMFYGWKAGEYEADEGFYGTLTKYKDGFEQTRHFYDEVRNYCTAKPYSKDKIKLNFQNPQFLGGWDKNKEKDCYGVILRKREAYYLAIIDKKSGTKIFDNDSLYELTDGDSYYEKMEYKLLPGPNKMLPKVFFAKSNLEYFAPSKEICRIKESGSFKKGKSFSLEDCHKLIDFYKASIAKHEDWSKFDFEFSDTESYEDISGFYREVEKQGYSLMFRKISARGIDDAVDKGKLYLFQIYNKDFSAYSKGTPNLHTLYFKILFDERNLGDTVFKLNGEAEMFYRPASVKKEEIIAHKAGTALINKNPDNPKKESIFGYDLIKDRRYTKRQFALHLPIKLNFSAEGANRLNDLVRAELRKKGKHHVIGIDRGERNLIYISVIDGDGRIVEQRSLNEIINAYKGVKHTVDYHKLLDAKEKERDAARKNWTSVENIKELKEGYISQVVNVICDLVRQYDAVIAMEDLNSGFKNSRVKVEKQVYQKFENMLVSKLQYLADKKIDPKEAGGLLRAYQLVNPKSDNKFQDGIIFYVPAWLTSKIDPATGFVNLLRPKYTSLEAAKAFIGSFDDIRYEEDKGLYAFDIDYTKFPAADSDYQKKWTLYSYGTRIRTFRNPDKNNEWDQEEIVLTDEFSKLFKEIGVDAGKDLKSQILSITDAGHIKALLGLISLMLQMRNSIINSNVDYLISPVKDSTGRFYDSRTADASLPQDADANGAYNIARKALWAIDRICEADEGAFPDTKTAISRADWLRFAQEHAR